MNPWLLTAFSVLVSVPVVLAIILARHWLTNRKEGNNWALKPTNPPEKGKQR